MPHDPARVAEARPWPVKARGDPQTASYELRADPPFSGDMVFHTRQADERP